MSGPCCAPSSVAGATFKRATACANFSAPRGTGDTIAYTEAQVQALARSCATMNDERRITLAQAVRCKQVTDQSFVAIDVARGAYGAGDLTKAQGQLELARTLLLEAERIVGAK